MDQILFLNINYIEQSTLPSEELRGGFAGWYPLPTTV